MEEDKQVPGCSFVMTADISLTKSSQLAKAWKIWMYNGTTKKEKLEPMKILPFSSICF